MRLRVLCAVSIVCLVGLAVLGDASRSSVLTDNQTSGRKSNFLPENTSFIKTGATFSWVKEGEFATDEETLKTGANPKRLFDGNNGAFWKSRIYSKWSGKPWVTICIDLQDDYKIEAVDVWRLHEKTRDTESVEVLLSRDGKSFESQGTVKAKDNVPFQAKTFLKIGKQFAEPVVSRYILLRIRRRKEAKQQQIGEIVVWGRK